MGTITKGNAKGFSDFLKETLESRDLNKFLESQGEIQTYAKKISDLESSTSVYNKEFSERNILISPYKLPFLGTNQDIFLLLFYFSYAFLTIVVLSILYKNTGSVSNTLYAFLMSVVFLLIISSLLFRVG